MESTAARARARARALLLEYLNVEQREALESTGHFDVVMTGSRRSFAMWLLRYPRFRVYRLSGDRFPVKLFTTEERLARSVPWCVFCIHPRGDALQDDALLSMKLLIEHDEPRFLRTAHTTLTT